MSFDSAKTFVRRSGLLMHARCVRSFLVLPLSLALLAGSKASAQQGSTFTMDGKPVPRSFYDAGQYVNQGINLLHANRNQEASQKLQQAVAIAPDFAEAHHNLGLALAKIGDAPQALQQFQLALTLKPSMDVTWLSMGGLYQSTGHVDDAIKTYKEYLNRFPHSKDAAKIASLVQGLQKERTSESRSALPEGRLPRAVASSDDYLADVTHQGVMRWASQRMPLKVRVNSGNSVAGFDPQYQTILEQSFEDWAKASHGKITFRFVSQSESPDIDCSWTADAGKFANTAEAGEARLSSNSTGIVRATIQLLTQPLMPGIPVTANRVRMICLHEIGHALGLTGHTSNPDDAMFYSGTITDQWRNLSQRDANTINRLYSSQ